MEREKPQIQLTNMGLAGSPDEEGLAASFREKNYVCLPQLLAPGLLARIQGQMARGRWESRRHGEIGHEVTLEDPIALNLLTFLMNRPDFLGWVERITGRGPLHSFRGRIYRMQPDSGHFDSWHDDIVPDEMRWVGLSINLGDEPYEGGIFRMRSRESGEILAEVPNRVAGDARIFAVREDLQHMVTPVTGQVAKTAYAGWFRGSGRGFLEILRGPRDGAF